MRKTFQFTFLSLFWVFESFLEQERVWGDLGNKRKKSRMESNCDEENKVALNSGRRRASLIYIKKEEMTEIHSLPVHDLWPNESERTSKRPMTTTTANVGNFHPFFVSPFFDSIYFYLYTVKTDEDCSIVSKMLFILFVLDSSKKEEKSQKFSSSLQTWECQQISIDWLWK